MISNDRVRLFPVFEKENTFGSSFLVQKTPNSRNNNSSPGNTKMMFSNTVFCIWKSP